MKKINFVSFVFAVVLGVFCAISVSAEEMVNSEYILNDILFNYESSYRIADVVALAKVEKIEETIESFNVVSFSEETTIEPSEEIYEVVEDSAEIIETTFEATEENSEVEECLLAPPIWANRYDSFNESDAETIQNVFATYELKDIFTNFDKEEFSMFFECEIDSCMLIFARSEELDDRDVIASTIGPNGEICSLVTDGYGFGLRAIL